MSDTPNPGLDRLQAAINEEIDKLPDDDTGGQGEPAHVALDREKAALEAATDESKDEPKEPEPKPAEASPAPEAEKESPSEPAAKPTEPVDLLAGYSEAERKALLKFAPGGRINTPEELNAARQAVADDYWRIQNRLAEKAREEQKPPAAEAPKAPEPPPAPPELQRLDTRIQGIEEEARNAKTNLSGWEHTKTKAQQDIADLERKKAFGSLEVEDQLQEAYRSLLHADRQIDGWNKHLKQLENDWTDLQYRRNEVATTLAVKTRLDAQEKAQQEQAKEAEVNSFRAAWRKAFDDAVKANNAEEDRDTLVEVAASRTHFISQQNGGIPIEDLPRFLNDVVVKYIAPRKAAAQKAIEDYIKEKEKDAPKPPLPGKKSSTAANASNRKPIGSLQDLERAVMETADWEG